MALEFCLDITKFNKVLSFIISNISLLGVLRLRQSHALFRVLAYLILVITICIFRVFLARASWKPPWWQTCDELLENHRPLIPSQNTWWSHVRYEGQWSGTPRDSQLLHSTCDLFHQHMAHRGPPLESIIEMFLPCQIRAKLSGHYSIPRGCPLNTGFTVLEFKRTN